ncbi:2106_t:CDS:2 [Acaulospora morrowiae]|uniref:RNA polymerase II transcription factor B subunit 3 n=1 Tax=Acaulospora morrowiae TaxID=94023 RepID=A0A9N9HWR6_9GLOM|nr:2106_t:CDS:2 [Acaulospora morrowiae]
MATRVGTITNDLGVQDLDESCPICKNTRYLTPTMKLLVSECYHKMCESCIDRLFANGAGPCPKCGITLRKINFVVPTFEDLSVEKEVRIRKKIAQQFNKRQEDFQSLQEYNDYLEMVEDIVWNLNSNINKQATDELIEKYARENRDIIVHNARRQIDEEKFAAYKQDREKREKRMQFENYKKSLELERKAKEEHQAEIINELANSKAPASKIIAAKKELGPKKPFEDPILSSLQMKESGVEWFGLDHVSREDKQEFDPVASEYKDIDHYTIKDKYVDSYLPAPTLLLKAGGYNQKFIYERSLQSAFSGIFDNSGSDKMQE